MVALVACMAKTVDISWASIKEGAVGLWERVEEYFSSITLYQQVAWGAVGFGLILVILALIVW